MKLLRGNPLPSIAVAGANIRKVTSGPTSIPILEKALGTIYRTVVEDTPFGDWLLTDVITSTLLAYRKARRRILRERERAQAERRERIAKGEATPADLKATTELPRKKRGEVGINRQMELLRGLFNFAIQHGLLRQESPFRL